MGLCQWVSVGLWELASCRAWGEWVSHAGHVLLVQDMLQMQYPKAEPSDVKRMLGLAYPDKENLQHLKLKQVIAAVEMFNKMDPWTRASATWIRWRMS